MSGPRAAAPAYVQTSGPKSIPVAVHYSSAPPPPLLDVAAILRDQSIVVDAAFDGRKRRRRAVLVFALFVLVVFGSLFAALGASYAHHG
jgi:hypothetical protein